LAAALLCGCSETPTSHRDTGPPPKGDQGLTELGFADTGGGSEDSQTAVDAPASCKHPAVTKSCSDGWCTIPAGCFVMGSPATEKCRETCWETPCPLKETQHEVTLTRDFELAELEVTQKQFSVLMGYNPSWFGQCGETCPVETVTWHQAAAYCNALSKDKGLAQCYECTGASSTIDCKVATSYRDAKIYSCPGYRLPTDAEWEYAYRAGTATALFTGEISECQAADTSADSAGWYKANSGEKTHPVGGKQANAWGLRDMAGNVWEWCHDWHEPDLGSAPRTDPAGPSTGTYKVDRGGSCFSEARFLRAAFREATLPTFQDGNVGFRCARSLIKP
jgi:formylglycine-generating enzyme required for sulfatase activity